MTVPVRECGEPLVAVPWALRLEEGPPVLLRAGVVQRLADAARLLSSGRLAVVEGYRLAGPQNTGGAVLVTLADAATDDRTELDEALATGADHARYGPIVGEPVPALVALGAG